MRWVPVSEGVPEVTFRFADADNVIDTGNELKFVNPFKCYESEPVLVQGRTRSYGTEIEGIFTAIYGIWEYYGQEPSTEWRDNMGGEIEIDVEAWMPLPESYKKEDNNAQ